MQYGIHSTQLRIVEEHATTFAISRSLHYGLFQVFEGIRFFCAKTDTGFELRFLNLHLNLARFRRGILYSLSAKDQTLVPSEEGLRDIFLQYFRSPELRPFLQRMAEKGEQGYFRPFTLDEEESIGVTFPKEPGIRGALCSYTRYLGEPFNGAVVPNLVRAVGVNGTGCLKLGSNYLLSVKAVQVAQSIDTSAAAALFLDDRPDKPVREREITEWDSSCCLIALKDGRIVKIPDGPLILPSVTIQGMVALARERGVQVEERPVSYGELLNWVENDEVVTLCSIGTAGILNRVDTLYLVDEQCGLTSTMTSDSAHPLYQTLADIRRDYWNIYLGTHPAPAGLKLERYPL
jgi:branched-subunit amino acid aminotransferase/4-amino-4-deoxychorismate lyase